MKRTSIITVNYRQTAMTQTLLKSISSHIPAESIEVIVVDNGSEKDEGALFKAVYPAVIYVRSVDNLGFAGGNNLGIRHSSGEFLLFINNDTEVLPGLVSSLCNELESHPSIGLLTPLILFYDQKDKIQYAGYSSMNYFTGRNNGLHFMENDNGQFDKTTVETGFCHGAAMICRRTDLEKAGVMDERYFLYYEELDWCEKFKKIGKLIAFTGKAKIYHKESISVGQESPLKVYFMTRNRWLFIRRNTNIFTTFIFSMYFLLIVFPKLTFSYWRQKRLDLVRAVWKGIRWNLCHSSNSMDLEYPLK